MRSLRYLFLVVGIAVCGLTNTVCGVDDPGERYIRAASRPGNSSAKRNTYLGLAQLHSGDHWVLAGPCVTVESLQSKSGVRHNDDIIAMICNIGIEALPVLSEALDDTTPSETFMYDSHKIGYDGHKMFPVQIRRWKVNELTAMLIRAIAEREFFVVEKGQRFSIVRVGETPTSVPRFQKLVLDWYANNAKKTHVQRMIDQVFDDDHNNSTAAISWLGRHKEKAGQDAIVKHVDTIFAAKSGVSSHSSELAASACALGQLGDSRSLGLVRRICRCFSESADGTEPPGMKFPCRDIFVAYHGLSDLGKKDEAMLELERLYRGYSAQMDDCRRKIYKENLDEARKKW